MAYFRIKYAISAKINSVYLHRIRKGAHVKMWELEIYAAVTIHNSTRRKEMIHKLHELGIKPKINEDRIELHYKGSREKVSRIADLCGDCPIHHINISKAES